MSGEPTFIGYTLHEYVRGILAPGIANNANHGIKFTAVHVHGTDKPDHTQFRKDGGLKLCQSMWRFHTKTNGWDNIAQHSTIDPDGIVWACRPLDSQPCSATGYNGSETAFPYMFEMIGHFEPGGDVLAGKQLETAVGLVKAVIHLMDGEYSMMHFHNEFTRHKTCPGATVDRSDFMHRVIAAPYVLDVPKVTVTPTMGGIDLSQAKETNFTVNGKNIGAGFILNGVSYVPARALSEKLGADIAYDQGKNVVNITTK
jgi:hypothetical protein